MSSPTFWEGVLILVIALIPAVTTIWWIEKTKDKYDDK
jgi:hypothetical protein